MDAFVDALDTWLNAEVETKCADKTGTETISGSWTFSNQITGSGGLKSGNNTITRSDGDVWTLPDAGTQDFVGTTATQTLSGKTFSGADSILLPTNAPTANRSIALVSNVLQIHDGTSAKSYLRTDTYNETTYSTGAISIGTTVAGAFGDVDATNASITFTVNCTGRYKIEFHFTHLLAANAAGAASTGTVRWRLTDGTTNKEAIETGLIHDGDVGNTGAIRIPVTMSSVFNFTSTGSKTIKLQYENITMTAIGTNQVLSASTSPLVMRAYRIAD
jgi:hypothetical protein